MRIAMLFSMLALAGCANLDRIEGAYVAGIQANLTHVATQIEAKHAVEADAYANEQRAGLHADTLNLFAAAKAANATPEELVKVSEAAEAERRATEQSIQEFKANLAMPTATIRESVARLGELETMRANRDSIPRRVFTPGLEAR